MSVALQLGAAVLWWTAIIAFAVSLGVLVLLAGCARADRRRDRDACRRAERLAGVERLTPEQRTLSGALDRLWLLDCAPDRNLSAERTSAVAALYDIERHGVRL